MLTKESVSNDNGGADIFIAKTVIVGVRDVINGIGTASFIQRVCLYQKRFPVTFFYFIYNCLYDGRLEVTGIPLFAKARFHRHHVFFTDRILKTGKIKQLTRLLRKRGDALTIFYLYKIDLTFHLFLHKNDEIFPGMSTKPQDYIIDSH